MTLNKHFNSHTCSYRCLWFQPLLNFSTLSLSLFSLRINLGVLSIMRVGGLGWLDRRVSRVLTFLDLFDISLNSAYGETSWVISAMMESFDRAQVTINPVNFDSEGMVCCRFTCLRLSRNSFKVFVSPSPSMVPKWTALTRPFSWQVWMLTVVSVILCSLAMVLCAVLLRFAFVITIDHRSCMT